MSETDEIRGLESVHKIKAIESTYEVREVKQDIVYLRKKALLLHRNAVLTGDWTYYVQLLDIQDRIRCHKEILEKYPYDGKSTFAEYIDKSHMNWDRISTVSFRISVYNSSRCYHKGWLQQVLNMDYGRIGTNSLGVSTSETKRMAQELLDKKFKN